MSPFFSTDVNSFLFLIKEWVNITYKIYFKTLNPSGTLMNSGQELLKKIKNREFFIWII